MLSIK